MLGDACSWRWMNKRPHLLHMPNLPVSHFIAVLSNGNCGSSYRPIEFFDGSASGCKSSVVALLGAWLWMTGACFFLFSTMLSLYFTAAVSVFFSVENFLISGTLCHKHWVQYWLLSDWFRIPEGCLWGIRMLSLLRVFHGSSLCYPTGSTFWPIKLRFRHQKTSFYCTMFLTWFRTTVKRRLFPCCGT